jgi:hypothetical protein
MYIYVFAAGGLLSALLFSRESFCPPSHFYGKVFVRLVIFMGGLLSALSFSREGFCPPCHFLTLEGFCPGGLLSYTLITIIGTVTVCGVHMGRLFKNDILPRQNFNKCNNQINVFTGM